MRLMLFTLASGIWLATIAPCLGQNGVATTAGATEFRVRAVPASRLVDSIGVNVHLSFMNTTYKDFDLVRSRLREVGIRHLRDHAITRANVGPNHEYYRRMRELASDGMKFSLIVFDNNFPMHFTDVGKLGDVFEWSGKSVEFYEGANEPNLTRNPNWATISRDRQQELFQAVRSNPALKSVKVLGPSPWGGNAAAIGDISPFVDYGNFHVYSGGQYPEFTGVQSIRDYLDKAKAIYPGTTMVATEAGYHSALATPTKHYPTPEPIVARYLPRMLLWNLLAGVYRTYIYELADTHARGDADLESNFGLVASTGRLKPSFSAVKNLIALFSDKGAALEYPELPFAVRGNARNFQVKLFEKHDGTLLVPIWIGEPAWNPIARTPIETRARPIELVLPPRLGRLRVHQFQDDGNDVVTDMRARNDVLALDVSDRLTVLEFSAAR